MPKTQRAVGILLGSSAYVLWALFPFYFEAINEVSIVEIIANRIIWSFVFLCIVITLTRRWYVIRTAFTDKRSLALLTVAAVFLAANWSTYVFSIVSNNALASSLGYFITPLAVVALGVIVLKEKLRLAQWIAVGIALLAVAVITLSYGTVPWIAIILAISWSIYGYIKKHLNFPAVESVAVEATVLLPIAIIILIVMGLNNTAALFSGQLNMVGLLMLAGPVTAIPLMLFAGSATRVPLTVLGVLEYITPVGLFIIGLVFFHEEMSSERWIGFSLIWVALVIFTVDELRHPHQAQPGDEFLIPEE
jgi:chloramphenicol-sensitive protein RarD